MSGALQLWSRSCHCLCNDINCLTYGNNHNTDDMGKAVSSPLVVRPCYMQTINVSSRDSNVHWKHIKITEDMIGQAGQIIPVRSERQRSDWLSSVILVSSVIKVINVHNSEVLELVVCTYRDNSYWVLMRMCIFTWAKLFFTLLEQSHTKPTYFGWKAT